MIVVWKSTNPFNKKIRLKQNQKYSISSNKTCKWVNIHGLKGSYLFLLKRGFLKTKIDTMKKSVNEKIINKVMQNATNFDML